MMKVRRYSKERKLTVVTLLSFVLISAILPSCELLNPFPDDTAGRQPILRGRWAIPNTYGKDSQVLFFNSQTGVFTIDQNADGYNEYEGQYYSLGGRATFLFTKGNFPQNCEEHGRYSYLVAGGRLRLTKEQDRCLLREGILGQIWRRAPEAYQRSAPINPGPNQYPIQRPTPVPDWQHKYGL